MPTLLRCLALAAALALPAAASAQGLPPCQQQSTSNGWDIQAIVGAAGDLYALHTVGTGEGLPNGATEMAPPELGIIVYPSDDIRRFVIRFPSFMLGDRHFSNQGDDDAVDEGQVTPQLTVVAKGAKQTLDPPDDSAPDPVTRWEFDWDPLGGTLLEGAPELTGNLVLDGTPVLSFRFDLSQLDAALADAAKAHDAVSAQLSAGACQV